MATPPLWLRRPVMRERSTFRRAVIALVLAPVVFLGTVLSSVPAWSDQDRANSTLELSATGRLVGGAAAKPLREDGDFPDLPANCESTTGLAVDDSALARTWTDLKQFEEEQAETLSALLAARELLERDSPLSPAEHFSRTPQPATPSRDELEDVRQVAWEYGVTLSDAEIIASARRWHAGDTARERAIDAIQLATIVAGAALGALSGVLDYTARHFMYDEPFTCVGLLRTLLTGAASGALVGTGLPVIIWTLRVFHGLETTVLLLKEMLPTFFEVNLEEGRWSTISTVDKLLVDLKLLFNDLLWATSPGARAATLALCAVEALIEDLLRGNYMGLRDWIETTWKPMFRDNVAWRFQGIGQSLEAEVVGVPLEPGRTPRASLTLYEATETEARVSFSTNQTIVWKSTVQFSDPGAHEVELVLFRGGSERGVAATLNASSTGAGAQAVLTGTLSTATLLTMAGGVQGAHQFRMRVTNTSQGWTEWAGDIAEGALHFDFDLRVNSKPQVTMRPVVNPFGIISFELTVQDEDNERPSQLVLRFDGTDDNLTSLLPGPGTPGVNWAEGYTLTRNKPVPQESIHTAQTRVSDSLSTTTSGPEESIRVAGLPYLVFPSVQLSTVGERKLFSVQLRDALGGLSGREIYLGTSQAGLLSDGGGTAIPKASTNASGWANFYYTPLETGQHTLTVSAFESVPDSISQTTNAVQPGCSPPDAFNLAKPSDGKANIGSSTELEWYTPDDVGTYDIYLGVSDPPPFFTSVPAEETFTQSLVVSGLSPASHYRWRVVARAECDSSKATSSVTRSFFTVSPAGSVNLLKPTNGAQGVPTTVVLDWENVSTPGTFLYDLYFGTTNPPPFSEAMQTRTVKFMSGLSQNTTYFWKVHAINAADPTQVTASATWSFQTGTGGATQVVLQAVRDAGLRGGSFGGQNYGGQVGGPAEQTFFGLGNTDDLFQTPGNAPLRGAVQFDLSSIPAGSNILDATMELAVGIAYGSQTTPLPLYVDPYSSTWSESAITWNSRPPTNLAHRVSEFFPISGWNPLELNITSLVQTWNQGVIPNHGMELSIPSWEGLVDHAKGLRQREGGAPVAPKLTILYGEPCPAPLPASNPSPPSGSTGSTSPLTLSWSAVSGASDYNFYFGSMNPPVFHSLLSSNAAVVDGLSASTTYYWRIESLADCDPTVVSSSPVWTFTTGSCVAPLAPVPEFPLDGAMNSPRNITLTWQPAAGAEDYEVYFGESSAPASVGSTAATAFAVIAPLPETTYYWKIRARRNCGGGLHADSPVRSFNTAERPTAWAGDPVTVHPGEPAILGGSPTATGGTPPYFYSWTVLADSGATVAPPNAANPTFIGQVEREFPVQLLVTDSSGFVAPPSLVTVLVLDWIFIDGFESGDLSAWD